MAGRFTLSIRSLIRLWQPRFCRTFGRFYNSLCMDLSKPIKPFFNFYEAHFFKDFLSSSLNLFIRRSSHSLRALPVKLTCLSSSEWNVWLRIPAIVSQSARDFDFLAETSVPSKISFEVVDHLKGAIFYKRALHKSMELVVVTNTCCWRHICFSIHCHNIA